MATGAGVLRSEPQRILHSCLGRPFDTKADTMQSPPWDDALLAWFIMHWHFSPPRKLENGTGDGKYYIAMCTTMKAPTLGEFCLEKEGGMVDRSSRQDRVSRWFITAKRPFLPSFSSPDSHTRFSRPSSLSCIFPALGKLMKGVSYFRNSSLYYYFLLA